MKYVEYISIALEILTAAGLILLFWKFVWRTREEWVPGVWGAVTDLLYIAWIPMVLCLAFEEYEFGYQYVGWLAAIGLGLYSLTAIYLVTKVVALMVIGIVGFFIVDSHDGVSPFVKFLALFYRHPAQKIDLDRDPEGLVASVATPPKSQQWSRVGERQLREMAQQDRVEADYLDAATDFLKAEDELAVAKAREEAAREALEERKRRRGE